MVFGLVSLFSSRAAPSRSLEEIICPWGRGCLNLFISLQSFNFRDEAFVSFFNCFLNLMKFKPLCKTTKILCKKAIIFKLYTIIFAEKYSFYYFLFSANMFIQYTDGDIVDSVNETYWLSYMHFFCTYNICFLQQSKKKLVLLIETWQNVQNTFCEFHFVEKTKDFSSDV